MHAESLKKPLTPIVLSIMVIMILPAISIGIGTSASPGVYLVFELYEHPGGTNRAVELSGADNIYTCVRAEAVLPGPPDFLLLGSGCYRGVPAVYIPYDRVKRAMDMWVSELSTRGSPSIDEHLFGLLVRAYVLNVTAGKVLYTILDSIPLRIGDLRTPQVVVYVVRNVKGWSQVFAEKLVKASVPANTVALDLGSLDQVSRLPGETTASELRSWQCNCYYWSCVCYELVAEIKPENLQGSLPSDYFNIVNGVVYLKTPVLIIDNVYNYSGVISGGINIYARDAKLEVRLSFATGEIIEKLRNGTYPSINIQLGGATFGGYQYYYYASNFIPNASAKWAYMWTRPIQRYWRVYLCAFGCIHLRDEVETLVTNILTTGAWIPGAWENGLPHTTVMNNFFSGTNTTNPQIPGTPLADGDLDVDESIAFRYIIQHYDTCGSGFEVGIPAGAYAAMAVCPLLGLGAKACAVAVAVASAFQVSLGLEGAQIYVDGGLQNLGRENGLGYDVYEIIYLRVSRYQYETPPPWWCPWCSPCRFSVPAGLYFRCV